MVHRLTKLHIEPNINYHISKIEVPNTSPIRYILKIYIEKSSNLPVILKFNNSSSVYVRHFGLTSLATAEEIRDLVMNSEQISFDRPFTDNKYDPNDFSYLLNYYKQIYEKDLTIKELISIGFISVDERLSNGAELFKDNYHDEKTLVECVQYLGVSKGDNIFYATKTICSNLLEEFKQIQEFVLTRSADGFIKKDEGQERLISYPLRALNESIVNALVHRNYFINGSQIEINLYKDRLEIVSPGSLPGSKHLDKEKDLASIPPIRRNEVICNVFSLLKLMEKKGSGFDKISEDYLPYGKQYSPYVTSSSNYFSLTLPDLSFKGGPVSLNVAPNVYVEGTIKNGNNIKILSYCYNEPKTIVEIAKYLNITPSTYFRKNVIDKLVEEGYLLRYEQKKSSKYYSNHNLVFPSN